MANYQFTVLKPDGSKEKRIAIYENERELMSANQRNGDIVFDIVDKGSMYGEVELSRAPKAKDLGIYCQQIHSILNAGVTVVEALEMVLPTTKNGKLRKATQSIIDDINAGLSMSEGMEKHMDVFPLVMVQMVKAGEASGKLLEIFDRLAIQFEKEFRLKSNIKKALSYPKMIIAVLAAALVVVCSVVVPMFVKIFDEMDAKLPWSTKMFIGLSNLFTKGWYIVLILGIVFFASWQLIKSSEKGQRFISQTKLNIPLINDLTMKTECANFARVFSTLLSSGRDYPDSLSITKDTTDNILYHEAIVRINDGIKQGKGLAECMKKEILFPDLMISMATIGEETGNVGGMLENAADYYEEEVESATLRVTGAIQPIVIVFLGVFVGLLVYSIYSPMFSMYSSIK